MPLQPHAQGLIPRSGHSWSSRAPLPNTPVPFQDTSNQALLLKIQQAMGMISQNQQLLFDQKNAHASLQNKVEYVSKQLDSLKGQIGESSGGLADVKKGGRAKIPSELSLEVYCSVAYSWG